MQWHAIMRSALVFYVQTLGRLGDALASIAHYDYMYRTDMEHADRADGT